MDLGSAIMYIMCLVGAFVGLFGWSHTLLRKRMDRMELKLHDKLTEHEARLLVDDKLAPQRVETYAIRERLGELYTNYKELNSKMDAVLNICRSLNGKK